MKRILKIIIILNFIFISDMSVLAEINQLEFYTSSEQVDIFNNEEASLKISCKSLDMINISTFRLKVLFDINCIKFKNIECDPGIMDKELKWRDNNGELIIVYLASNEGINLHNQKLDLFHINFKALNDCENSKIRVKTILDGVGDKDSNKLIFNQPEIVFWDIKDKPTFDCRLKSLKLTDVDIFPDFDPDITDYNAFVNSDINRVEIDAIPNNSEANVVINRNKLNKAGENTEIQIKVYSKDKKNKMVYHVNVERCYKKDKTLIANKIKDNNKSENNIKNSSLGISEIKPLTQKTIILKQNEFSWLPFALALFALFGAVIIYNHKRKNIYNKNEYISISNKQNKNEQENS